MRFLSLRILALNGQNGAASKPAPWWAAGLIRWMIRDEKRRCDGRSGDCDRRIGDCSRKSIGALAESRFF
jgi:hypothetical protein